MYIFVTVTTAQFIDQLFTKRQIIDISIYVLRFTSRCFRKPKLQPIYFYNPHVLEKNILTISL